MAPGVIAENEFSRIVDLAELPEGGKMFEFSASAEECTALARRFGLLGLEYLDVRLILSWLAGENVLSVRGTLDAFVVQTCVVTLEPVRSPFREEMNLAFARDLQADDSSVELDDAEPLQDDMLDLGELAAEELALGLDPYPRSPDIDPALLETGPGISISVGEAETPEHKRDSPFGRLAELKNKL